MDPRHSTGASSTSLCSSHTRTMKAEAWSSSSTSWLSHMGGHGSKFATAPTLAIHRVPTGAFYQTGVTSSSRLRHKAITRAVGWAIRAIFAAGSTISQRSGHVDCEFRPRKLSPSFAQEHRRRLTHVHQAGHGLVDALQGARCFDDAMPHQVKLIHQLGDFLAARLPHSFPCVSLR